MGYKKLIKLILGLVFLSSYVSGESTDPEFFTVDTPAGPVKGRVLYSGRQKRKFYAFTGIPYAKPPVDGLRFMNPQPVKPHEEVLDATKEPPECLQWDHLRMRGVVGQEDCLYLNIYTYNRIIPGVSYNTHPIVAFVHAGTWVAGGAANDFFTPDYLVENSVCVVTMNHRLGALGFLSLEDQEAPGNYGAKDVMMALDYVKTNGWHFGCMNVSITVMGTGAGGTLAHLLTMSPKTRADSLKRDDQHALFHAAISHSGNAYMPHAISRDAKRQALKMATSLGCVKEDSTSSQILNCLRNVDGNALVSATTLLFKWDEEPLPFGPVIDSWMGRDAFLPDEPHHLIQQGQFLQVPWLSGTNSDDGAFRVQDIIRDPHLVKQLNNEWEKWGPTLLHLTNQSCIDPIDVSKTIRDYYMKGKKFGDDSAKLFVEMMTDRFFTHPTERAMKDHCKHYIRERDLCYRYILDYCGRKSFLDVLHSTLEESHGRNPFGVGNPRFQNTRDSHGWGVSFMDELFYLFPSPKLKLMYKQSLFDSDGSSSVSTAMISFWTNFIKGGDPTPTIEGYPDDVSPWGTWWDPYYHGHDYIFKLDPDLETSVDRYRAEQMDFWNSLPLFENTDSNVLRDEL